MDKQKTSYNTSSSDSSLENLTDMPSHDPSASDIEKMKKLYLPKSKEDFKPSEESIESSNGLSHPKPPSPNSLT